MTTEAGVRIEGGELAGCCHPACIVCGDCSNHGMGVRFRKEVDGSVVGSFACGSSYQGYPDRLHGGVVAMLLDAAMTHCLFARQVRGVTAKLDVSFRHPVEVGVPAAVRAEVERESPPLYVLKAQITQGDTLCAVAEGMFTSQESDVSSRGESG